MPRQKRHLSYSGYLHVIVRGVSRQTLFEETEDYLFFLSILEKYAGETDIAVCAYCLMENHVHLLIKDSLRNTPLFMKKIGVSYSGYFNKKYDRCGHLFQDRYISEPVDNPVYLRTVFRYILNNPPKAGICSAKHYPWSSYGLYHNQNSFIDTDFLCNVIDDIKELDAFISTEDQTECMECNWKTTDSKAREEICTLLNVESGTAIQSWNRESRNNAIRKLKKAGLSIRQIERLTGIGRNIIQRA